jgi:flagellar export protein FliJ
VSTFRFRAQPALDLRRRELEAAQRDLARAEWDRAQAREAVEIAARAEREAKVQGGDQAREAKSAADLQWYRFWILRLEHERRSAEARLTAREADVTRAAAACMRAKQRCESLERFREKAQQAFDRKEADAERKLIDELATLRYNERQLIP